MDAISSQMTAFASQNIFLAVAAIYLGTILLGNIGAFTSIWFAVEGILGAWGVPLALVALCAASFSGDSLWYWLGRGLRGTRFGGWLRRRIPSYGHEKFQDHLERKGTRWMIFGKFAYGANVPIIFSIGWTRAASYPQFVRNSLVAISIWMPVVAGVSYALYSGLAPLAAAVRTVKDLEVAFLVGLVLFVLVQYGVVRVMKMIVGK